MTSYRTTMREALETMNEDNLEKMRKAAGGAKQTLKMKDGSIGMDSFSASAIMQIYDKINDKNKKTFENMMNNGKKADIVKLQKFAMSKVNAEYVPEEFELDEEKGPRQLVNPNKEIMVVKKNKVIVIDKKDKDKYMKQGWSLAEEVELDEAKYDLYHKDFSSAMQHAYKMAKKLHGITVDPKEIDDKVASGPRKPSEGKTNSYRLKGDKGAIQVQVYNKGGSKPFELNMYKEEVELDEAEMYVIGYHFLHGLKNQNMKKSKDFKTKKEAEKAANDIVRAKGGRAEVYANMFDPDGRPGHQDYPELLKTIKEEVELDEGKMSQLHQLMKDGKSAKEIAKIMKLDVKTIKALVDEQLKESSARRDAMRAMRRGKEVDPADIDDIATDDDVKAASKNIMMQLRKAVSLRSYDVEFADGKKQKVNQKIAQAVQNKYNSMRRPADKEKFQSQIAKSYKDMLQSLKAGYGEQKESILDRIGKKLKERKNG